jgi:hypothetical protein
MMIDERIDRRSMYEDRAADEEVNCYYRIELIAVDYSSALSKGLELTMTDGGVIVGQRLCGRGEWESGAIGTFLITFLAGMQATSASAEEQQSSGGNNRFWG